jgi:glycosyltransferase involved in cell wall biosynthesis
MPKVSIYLPTKDRCELLQRAVASVQAQTESDWELIIVDDASSDDTPDYLAQLTQQDPRVQVIRHQQSTGAPISRNQAIAAAQAELVTGLDDDDEFVPDRLATLLAHYNSDYAFVCAGMYWVTANEQKVLWGSRKVVQLNDMLTDNMASNQVLVAKERIMAIGGFTEDLPALQDYDCWVRLIKAYGPALRIAQPLMRVHVAHGLGRISSNPKVVAGYRAFYHQHQHAMSMRQRLRFKLRIKEKARAPGNWRNLLARALLKVV